VCPRRLGRRKNVSELSSGSASSTANSELSSRLLKYTNSVDSLETPEKVLNALDEVTNTTCKIRMLGALLLPLRWGDLSSFEMGKTVFLHGSAPKGWWEEQRDMMRQSPGPGEMLARLALAPFTMSETMSRLDPLGVDRWPFELALKYGMRDRLSCPVGGRWLVYSTGTKATKRRIGGQPCASGAMDVELAVDAMRLGRALDHLVLFSGRAELKALVCALQEEGKRVTVVSTLATGVLVVDEMRRQADQYVDLAELKDQIRLPAGGAIPRQ
jgi:uncharacterized LabA/DUF88 family protein